MFLILIQEGLVSKLETWWVRVIPGGKAAGAWR